MVSFLRMRMPCPLDQAEPMVPSVHTVYLGGQALCALCVREWDGVIPNSFLLTCSAAHIMCLPVHTYTWAY